MGFPGFPSHRMYAHTVCRALAALQMEDTAMKHLARDPNDPIRKMLLKASEKVADEVCSRAD